MGLLARWVFPKKELKGTEQDKLLSLLYQKSKNITGLNAAQDLDTFPGFSLKISKIVLANSSAATNQVTFSDSRGQVLGIIQTPANQNVDLDFPEGIYFTEKITVAALNAGNFGFNITGNKEIGHLPL